MSEAVGPGERCRLVDDMPFRIETLRENLGKPGLASFLWSNTREGMAFVNRANEIEFVNQALSEMLGYGIYEMQGMAFGQLHYTNKDAEADAQAMQKVWDGKVEEHSMNLDYKHKLGRKIPGHLRMVAMPQGYLVFAQVMPVTVLDIANLPDEETKRVMSMLVGQWVIHNWRRLLMAIGGISGIANIDRIFAVAASVLGG